MRRKNSANPAPLRLIPNLSTFQPEKQKFMLDSNYLFTLTMIY